MHLFGVFNVASEQFLELATATRYAQILLLKLVWLGLLRVWLGLLCGCLESGRRLGLLGLDLLWVFALDCKRFA